MELGDVLQSLQQAANELESIVYEFNMSPPITVSEAIQDPLHSSAYYKLMELRDKENILSRELFTQEATLKALNLDPVSADSNSTETLEDKLKTLILNHKQNLLTATAQKVNDNLLLRRIQQAHSLSHFNVIFSENSENLQHEEIKLLSQERDEMVMEIIRTSKEIEEKENKLREIVVQSAELSARNRELFGKLKKQEGNNEDEETEKLQDLFSKHKSRNAILRNVYQALIIESGVDWSQDPKLVEFFMGKDFQQ